jgi:hypothetical protein
MSLEQHSPARYSPPKRSFTINEWCAMRRYSRVYFYKMRRKGDAPDVIGEGKAQRITDSADARWLKRQEQKAKRRGVKNKTAQMACAA